MVLFTTMLVALAAPPSDLRLTGLVTATTRPIAVLVSGGRTRVVTTGESAFGGRLVSVAPGQATLQFDGTAVVVKLDDGRSPTDRIPPPARTAAAASRPSAATDAGAADAVRTMTRAEVQARLATELPQLLAETKVTPLREDGRVVGLTLTRMPANSLLLDAGLSAGDVITRINDVEIDGMGTLIGLWPRLQFASELRATVLRDGSPVSLRVSLR